VDLSSEGRALDAFVNDLVAYDKKGAELGKKASLTRAEFATYERSALDLKPRVSSLQNVLRQIITKLKAAGQFDSIDQIVLAKINDRQFQELVRRDGFKRTLEEAAAGLSNDAKEIDSPLDALRSKVQARGLGFERDSPPLASRAVRVAYSSAPPVFAANFRCRIAWLREGVTMGINGGTPSDKSKAAVGCHCYGDQGACSTLQAN